eukprot:9200579-Alexandrium_andersonii.AAC.1
MLPPHLSSGPLFPHKTRSAHPKPSADRRRRSAARAEQRLARKKKKGAAAKVRGQARIASCQSRGEGEKEKRLQQARRKGGARG